MDTQIRRVTPAPSSLVLVPAPTVVLQEINLAPIDWSEHNVALAFDRVPLPVPAAACLASFVSTKAATVPLLRDAILECARQANVAEPSNTDARLHSFVAKLSGRMEGLGELGLDRALWDLMKTPWPPAHSLQAEAVDASTTEQLGGAYL